MAPWLCAVALAVTGCKEDKKLKVTGLEPTVGDSEGGTTVLFSGNRFQKDGVRGVKVYFGNAQANVLGFASDSELRVQAPGGKAGSSVDVKLFFEPGGVITIPNAFKYVTKTDVTVDDLTKGKK